MAATGRFLVRFVPYQGHTHVVVAQNSNGPCPLIALCNILSLKGLIALRSHLEDVGGARHLGWVRNALRYTANRLPRKSRCRQQWT